MLVFYYSYSPCYYVSSGELIIYFNLFIIFFQALHLLPFLTVVTWLWSTGVTYKSSTILYLLNYCHIGLADNYAYCAPFRHWQFFRIIFILFYFIIIIFYVVHLISMLENLCYSPYSHSFVQAYSSFNS